MTRGAFGKQLEEVQNEILDLGSMVEKAVRKAVAALKARDLAASREVVEGDLEINRRRFAVEEHCVHLIATQAPMASDLRTLIAALSIVTDLERMADHAEGIGRISLMIGEEPLLRPLGTILEMTDRVVDMLHQSLTAFIQRDANLAYRVCELDDEVDRLYDQTYHEVIQQMIREPEHVGHLTYHLWTSHNLERVGDRATNIAERVIYLVTGRMEEINVSSY